MSATLAGHRQQMDCMKTSCSGGVSMLVQCHAGSCFDSVSELLVAVSVRHGSCSAAAAAASTIWKRQNDKFRQLRQFFQRLVVVGSRDSGGGGGERVWPIRDAVVGVPHTAAGLIFTVLCWLLCLARLQMHHTPCVGMSAVHLMPVRRVIIGHMAYR